MSGARRREGGQYLVVGSVLLAMLLATLDNLVLGTAMPTVVAELGGVAHLSWVVTAYALTTAVSTPVWGKLGDMYGRKGTFMVAIALFLVASALAGASGSMAQLIAFRALQGLGGGGLMVGALAIVGTVVPLRDQGRYQGLIASVMGLTTVGGPVLGGFLTDGLGWRWCFYVNLPFGVLALVLVGFSLRLSEQRSRARIDVGGIGLMTLLISAVVLVTAWGGSEFSWLSLPVAGLVAAAAAAVAGLVWVERRAEEPVLPPRLFRNTNFVLVSAVGLGLGALMFGTMTFLPVFLQDAWGARASHASLLMLPHSLAMMVVNIVAGRWISRTGRYKVFATGGASVAMLGMILMAGMTPSSPLAYCWAAMAAAGAGTACLMQTAILITLQSAPRADLGAASATATLARTVGGSVGVSLMGALFAGQVSDRLRAAAGMSYRNAVTDGSRLVFLCGTGVGLAVLAAASLIREAPLTEPVVATEAEAAERPA